MDNPFYKSGPDARSDATRRPGADLPTELAAPVPVLMMFQTLPPPSRRTPVAVVVAGLDRLHPRANRPLYDSIVREGLLVSLSADGALPHRRDLLASQGLLAALTQATVVVEAAARSGALHVAVQARSFGRPVMAIPGPVTSAASSGTNRLIASGQADLVTSAEEVRARLTVGEVPGVETVVLRPGAGPAVGAWERVVAPSRPGSVEPDPHTRQVRHDIPLF